MPGCIVHLDNLLPAMLCLLAGCLLQPPGHKPDMCASSPPPHFDPPLPPPTCQYCLRKLENTLYELSLTAAGLTSKPEDIPEPQADGAMQDE